MDAYNYARMFAKDLVMFLTRSCGFGWEPVQISYNFRECEFTSEFRNRIGLVVFYFYHVQKSNPGLLPESAFLSMRIAHDYVYNKLLLNGNDFFNVLDYCGQLFWFAQSIYMRGFDLCAFDLCIVFIANTIAHLMKEDEIPEQTYWQELVRTANKITIPQPTPVYYPQLHRVNL